MTFSAFKLFQATVAISTLALLSSCADTASGVKYDAERMVKVNASAQSHIEWEGSEYNPQAVVKNYQTEYANKKAVSEAGAKAYAHDICKGLKIVSDQSLALFDGEINSAANAELFAECKVDLLARINKYFSERREALKYTVDATKTTPSNIDFKLNMEEDSNLEAETFSKYWANLKDHEVILTFDDGPDAVYTDSILRTLKEAGDLKAMFFTLGKKVVLNKAQVVTEYKTGHVVANHSWNHMCLKDSAVCDKYNAKTWSDVPHLSDSYTVAEIEKTFEAIHSIIGEVAPFMRFPFGEEREVTKQYLKDRGIVRLNWSIDSNDWQEVQKIAGQPVPYSNADMIKSTIDAIEVKKKGLVLFHDVHRRTAESLPQFLYELYKRQYKVIVLRGKSINTVSTTDEILNPTYKPGVKHN